MLSRTILILLPPFTRYSPLLPAITAPVSPGVTRLPECIHSLLQLPVYLPAIASIQSILQKTKGNIHNR
jgi:hypothetical protein